MRIPTHKVDTTHIHKYVFTYLQMGWRTTNQSQRQFKLASQESEVLVHINFGSSGSPWSIKMDAKIQAHCKGKRSGTFAFPHPNSQDFHQCGPSTYISKSNPFLRIRTSQHHDCTHAEGERLREKKQNCFVNDTPIQMLK